MIVLCYSIHRARLPSDAAIRAARHYDLRSAGATTPLPGQLHPSVPHAEVLHGCIPSEGHPDEGCHHHQLRGIHHDVSTQ